MKKLFWKIAIKILERDFVMEECKKDRLDFKEGCPSCRALYIIEFIKENYE